MSKKETIKRYGLFVVSLFITGFGVAFSKCAELGVSPVSSVANVMSLGFSRITIGNVVKVINRLIKEPMIAYLKK